MAMRKTSKNNPARRSPLIWWIVGGGLLVLLAAGLLALSNRGPYSAVESGGNGTPSLSVDQDVIDFGQVKLGETVTASFTLTNTGDSTLTFSQPPRVELKKGC